MDINESFPLRGCGFYAGVVCLLMPHALFAGDFYVAANGSDTGTGKEVTPWATIDHAMKQVQPGDTLFVRGGVYRLPVALEARNGCVSGQPDRPITIKAYPNEEPCFFPSKAFGDPGQWEAAGDQLWETAVGSVTGYDVGSIWHDDRASEKKWARAKLEDPWDFWFDAEQQRVVVYAEANPATLARHIEIPIGLQWQHAIQLRNVAHLVLEGLTVRYTNTHGIQFSNCHHITVRHCHISHGGGAWIWEDRTRYGNAVELYGAGHDITVEDCDIAWFFDTGITNQGDTGDQYNIRYRNNRIAHTKCGLEHWATGAANVRDVLYEGNTITDTGDNWAHNMQNVWGAVRLMRWHPNGLNADQPNTGIIENFVVRNNLILRCGSTAGAQRGEAVPFDEHPSIRLVGGPYIVENNTIRDGRSVGIYASHGFHGVIRGNTVTGCAGVGLELKDISEEATVEGNRLSNNGDVEN